jgi:hypothetical protein
VSAQLGAGAGQAAGNRPSATRMTIPERQIFRHRENLRFGYFFNHFGYIGDYEKVSN